MKHLLLALAVFFSAFVWAQSPITLTSSDMPLTGTTQRRAMDTLPLPSVSVGNPGANQTYNFSNLVVYKYDTVKYRTLTNNQQSNFPNADVAITTDGTSFLFSKTTGTNYSLQGFDGPFAGTQVTAQLSPVNVVYRFPATYGNTATGSWGFQEVIPGSDLGLPAIVDDVRVTFTATNWDTIDGWGKTVTPLGAYPSLRNVRKEYSRTLIEYNTIFNPSYTTQSDTRDTTIRYSYHAKESKGALVTLEYDSLDNLKDVIYSMVPPPAPSVSFTDASGGGGLINFTSSVSGYHDNYSWNFGDGTSTSTQQNPSHAYTANGAYYVCLTVYNGTVSTTYCDSVHVTGIISGSNNAPVAINDAYTVAQASSQIFHVAENDVDADGDNICVTSVWGGQFATEYIGGTCDMILFAPDSSFIGNDTCYYSLCDNGQPVLCDTGMVVFTVLPNAVLRPIANNDAVTILQPADTTVDVTNNDIAGSTGNSFCITAIIGSSNFSLVNCDHIRFDADSSYTGTETCTYIICDNSQATLCDTATLTVTVTPNAALLPVASFYFEGHVCQGGLFINTSQNASGIATWNYHVIEPTHIGTVDSMRTGDTVRYYGPSQVYYYLGNSSTQACLTVSNQYGSSTICDTVSFGCSDIQETSLSNIYFYPNPANSHVVINMSNNQDGITQSYAAIEVYNVLGERQMATAGNSNKVANLDISSLPQGMYVATLVGNKGGRRTLGRFVKE